MKVGAYFGEEKKKETMPGDVKTITDLHDHIESEFQKKKDRLKVEEQYVRATFLIDKKVNARLNEIKARKDLEPGGRGWKTMAFNKAILAVVEEYERLN